MQGAYKFLLPNGHQRRSCKTFKHYFLVELIIYDIVTIKKLQMSFVVWDVEVFMIKDSVRSQFSKSILHNFGERLSYERRNLVAVLVASSGAFIGFNLLFSVVPVVAERRGGQLGAGLSTGVFMITTVLGQLSVRTVLRTVRHREVLVLGLLLIGLPAVLYAATDQILVILTITAIRGIGFGFCTVIATLLIISYVGPSRRGSAIGMFGLVSSGTSVFGPSLGLVMLDHWGSLMFVVPATVTLILAPVAFLCPHPEFNSDRIPSTYREMLGNPLVRRPLVLLLPGTLLFGGVYTFIPLEAPEQAKIALLLFGLAMAITRTAAGRATDTIRPEIILVASVLLAAVGALFMALQNEIAVLLVGAILGGLGTGGMMTGSLVVVLSRVCAEDYSGVSTLWNASVDSGLALGGVGLGLVAQFGGEVSIFVAAFAVFALVTPVAVLDFRSRTPSV